jgi:hypothetical protein
MSVKKEIFKTIGDLLTENLKNLPDGLPDLKWFDKQMGQFNQPDTAFTIPLPAVLMEYGPVVWETTGVNNQKGSGKLKFTVYYENYAGSFTGSSDQVLALQFFDFTTAIHRVLQGFGIDDLMSAMTRTGDAEDITQDTIIASVMEYSMTVFDHSTDRTRNYIDVDPDLSMAYKDKSSRPAVTDTVPVFLT